MALLLGYGIISNLNGILSAMARHLPLLKAHAETIRQLFAFVREATGLTNGKLERAFGFCPPTVTTTGRDWGRWAKSAEEGGTLPYMERVNHVLNVVLVGKNTTQWKPTLSVEQRDTIREALAFTDNPNRRELDSLSFDWEEEGIFVDEHYGAWMNDERKEQYGELDRLRVIASRYSGLGSRLAQLVLELDGEVAQFADRHLKIFKAQYHALDKVQQDIASLPGSFITNPEDESRDEKKVIKNGIVTSKQAIAELIRLFDYRDSPYPAWVCFDVITRCMKSSKEAAPSKNESD